MSLFSRATDFTLVLGRVTFLCLLESVHFSEHSNIKIAFSPKMELRLSYADISFLSFSLNQGIYKGESAVKVILMSLEI